ncbi:hypothetical protein NADFUDRAFT_81099, partial [Nadsonia fulvescens var. elongata DSM 6958]
MRQIRISIRIQLVIVVSFVMVLSLMILTVATTVNNARSILDLRGEQLQTIAMLKSAQVTQALSALFYLTYWFSLASEPKMALARYKAGNTTRSNWSEAQQSLQATLDSSEVLLMGTVYDTNFNLVFNSTTNVTNITNSIIDLTGPLFPFDARKQNQTGQDYLVSLLNKNGGYVSEMVRNGSYAEPGSFSVSKTSSSQSGTSNLSSLPPALKLTTKDETNYFMSITLPIYGNASVLLETPVLVGYTTLAMRAASLYNIIKEQAGIQNEGQMVLLSSVNNFNPLSSDFVYLNSEDIINMREKKYNNINLTRNVNQTGIDIPKNTYDLVNSRNYMPGFVYLFPVADDPRNLTRNSIVYPSFSYFAYRVPMFSLDQQSGFESNGGSPMDNSVSVGYAIVDLTICKWVVAIEQPHSEMFSSISKLIKVSVLTAIGLGIGITMAIFPIAHYAVAPVRRLMAATKQTTLYTNNKDDNNHRRMSNSSDESYDTTYFRIPGHIDQGRIFVSNELTRLTETFNRMTDELHKQYSYLEDRVQERTRELSLAKTAAENANEAKTIFIANITHELRTPLNGILGMTAVSLTETDHNQIRRSLRVIFKSGELLLHLLTDLLTFSKNHKSQKDTPHRMTLDEREFYITEISSQVRAIFGKQARDKAVDLTLRIRPARQIMQMGLYADSNRILQIVINMTSNALKFTPKGGKVDIAIVLLGEFDPVATADNGYERLCVKLHRNNDKIAVSEKSDPIKEEKTKNGSHHFKETPASSPDQNPNVHSSLSSSPGSSNAKTVNNSDNKDNRYIKNNEDSDSFDSESDFESEELYRLADGMDGLETEVVMHIGPDSRRTSNVPTTPKDNFTSAPLSSKKNNSFKKIHLLNTPIPEEITSILSNKPPGPKRSGSSHTTSTTATTPLHSDILRKAQSLDSAPLTLIFEFTVSDNGPGIAPELRERVFEPFVQGEQNLSRQHGGTGLGLSICRQLATMMGGFMQLDSEQGVGSSFTLQVPIKWTKKLDFDTSEASTLAGGITSSSSATPQDTVYTEFKPDGGFSFEVTPDSIDINTVNVDNDDFHDFHDDDENDDDDNEDLFDAADDTY